MTKNYEEIAKALYYDNEVILKAPDGAKYKIKVEDDEWAESPRKWDNVCHITSISSSHWCIGDEGYVYPKDKALDVRDELLARDDIAIKPVYMYDHSGQTISLSDFGDPWDSGICGYIFVSKEEMFKEMGNITEENWKERAYEAMKGEIEVYDYYIRGEVYGYIVYKAATIEHRNVVTDETWKTEEWEEEDSCWGYYGYEHDESGLLDGALECLPDDLKIVKE